MVNVNKYDRVNVDKTLRPQTISAIEAIREQLRAHDPSVGECGIVTGEGAIPSLGSAVAGSNQSIDELNANIANAQARIGEIDIESVDGTLF